MQNLTSGPLAQLFLDSNQDTQHPFPKLFNPTVNRVIEFVKDVRNATIVKIDYKLGNYIGFHENTKFLILLRLDLKNCYLDIHDPLSHILFRTLCVERIHLCSNITYEEAFLDFNDSLCMLNYNITFKIKLGTSMNKLCRMFSSFISALDLLTRFNSHAENLDESESQFTTRAFIHLIDYGRTSSMHQLFRGKVYANIESRDPAQFMSNPLWADPAEIDLIEEMRNPPVVWGQQDPVVGVDVYVSDSIFLDSQTQYIVEHWRDFTITVLVPNIFAWDVNCVRDDVIGQLRNEFTSYRRGQQPLYKYFFTGLEDFIRMHFPIKW